jgi:YNFM family putative membrane transporter
MGGLTDRRSRRSILLLGMGIMAAGAVISLVDALPLALVGTAATVFGFFGAHAVISGWVSSWGAKQRAQSSALYLFGYHVGSSIAGFVGGLFYAAFGWPGEVGTVLVLLAAGFAIALSLPAGHREPDTASVFSG